MQTIQIEHLRGRVIGRIYVDGVKTECFLEYVYLNRKLRNMADLMMGKVKGKKPVREAPVIPETYKDPEDNLFF